MAVDPFTLANLLRRGYVAESCIPPPRMMEPRELVRYRVHLVRQRTQLENGIHSYPLQGNAKMEAKPFTPERIDLHWAGAVARRPGALPLPPSDGRPVQRI